MTKEAKKRGNRRQSSEKFLGPIALAAGARRRIEAIASWPLDTILAQGRQVRDGVCWFMVVLSGCSIVYIPTSPSFSPFHHFPPFPSLGATHIRLAGVMPMPLGAQLPHAFKHLHGVKRLIKFIFELLVEPHNVRENAFRFAPAGVNA